MPPDPRLGEIEAYLKHLNRELRRLGSAERGEIVKELRSHLLEKLNHEPHLLAKELFAPLGSPRVFAQTYLEELGPTQVTWPWLNPLQTLLYGAMLLAFIVPLLKLMFPRRVGVWVSEDDFSVYLLSPHILEGRDILGMWLIPLNIAIGVGLYRLVVRQRLRQTL